MAGKTVRDIMSKDCVTVTLQDNVYEIALKMKQHDIGFVAVVDGKKLIGVVTDRDLVVRGYAEKHSGSTAVEKVITKDIATIDPNTSIEEAAKIMAKNQIRRLPVVENGELVGIVAIGDLAVRGSFEDEAGQALGKISSDKTPVGAR
ncbi:CBS domain-containing protein [Paenibacillus sp. CGMCC 1.16610]|uniref:CBS domain-containing protein n=2 Tax=Paenibacillus TaxID=44249 RepID=A0ABU3RB55_9BACL|nr:MULTISPECIES: CBS domain-containing protein [Paenibacillus]MBA2937952.1 CBS domain-containing protein [Paenibacillus sp. CGMCC 1.16610]MDU0201490.1 CBS domain-containing protein [Paenibacillus sp. PFR10]MEC0268485.1 CBS domain-containing protein [Paenibacillus anseongense]MVQ37010.1 CBS domain-containing protein [Paenibacillus anseongense]